MSEKLLIVGGTGFIGKNLTRKAVESGFLTTVISLNLPKEDYKVINAEYLQADVTNLDHLKKTLLNRKFDYIVNLSGYIDHSDFMSGGMEIINAHFDGVQNLLQVINWDGLKKFIQIGSSAEYGALNSPHKEINITNPKSYYGKAKCMATNYLMKLNKKKKFPLTILRPYQVFGPKQDSNRLIPFVIKNCLDDKTFPCSSGNQFRDFIFIEDIIEVILKCLNNKKSQGEIFNVGSGKPKRVRQVISLIRKTIRLGKPKYGTIKLRKEEQLNFFPSISKAKLKIKWKPRHSFIDSLNKTIKSYKK